MQVADEAGAAASGDDERGQRVTNLLKGGVLFVKVRFLGLEFMTQYPLSVFKTRATTSAGSASPTCARAACCL